ncbi:hypothetical protein LOTGIDRAFT_159940 [Lottia gigantea]|uniref:Uncharacterized protein n=1 Tax=Lottia gigantea TaxID=225164 RepID=V4C4P3_LOTGI|nr:hypothetical protein LOTGIDRAFT_159940 [Lottia gigantea]ESO96524.1 hypothetical protein LOTGIDRAFT_159940 [Lottia gigantea]
MTSQLERVCRSIRPIYDSENLHYSRIIEDASNGFTGRFKINGKVHNLPVTSTGVFLFTTDTIPYWFSSSAMILVHNYFAGSPFKVSTLHKNGSITVHYLGYKFDPLCKNLNCRHEDIVYVGVIQKLELVDPNAWGSFQTVMVPYGEGIPGARQKIPGNLVCRIDEEL